MIGRLLKPWMPRSLYLRAVLIVLVPVLTLLAVGSVVFIQRLYEDVTRQMTDGVSKELRLILQQIEDDSLDAAKEIAVPLGIEVFEDSEGISDSLAWSDLSGRTVVATLREQVPGVYGVDLNNESRRARVGVQSDKGRVVLEFSRRRLSARNPHQFLVLFGLVALLMTVIALLYLRNQIQPIRRLAFAADAFGKGRSVPYRLAGATEVRQAGAAFLNMRARIERQIEQRTMMLSGVSHDLRTPLTRLRLQLSMMEGPEVKDMERDVSDMEDMLDAFLTFARGDALDDPERADPLVIAQNAVERGARGGAQVQLGHTNGEGTAMLRPAALARALDNLVSNAVRYAGSAEVSVAITDDRVQFSVEDPGPGIPKEQREDALKPFNRLDAARNQDSGLGVGLGLSIASDIARRHGGALLLESSEKLGGLRAVISIPR